MVTGQTGAGDLLYVEYLSQETARYRRFKHWLPPDVIEPRVALCHEIIAILTATIKTLRDHP